MTLLGRVVRILEARRIENDSNAAAMYFHANRENELGVYFGDERAVNYASTIPICESGYSFRSLLVVPLALIPPFPFINQPK